MAEVADSYTLSGNVKRWHSHPGMFTGTAETTGVFPPSVLYRPVAETRRGVRLPSAP